MNQNGWQTTEAGQKMLNTLSEERTLTSLTRLLEKMEVIEQSLENLHRAVQQGPAMVSILADAVDETFEKAKSKGVDLDQRVQNLIQLSNTISDPALVDKLDMIFSTLNKAPGLSATFVDSLDEEVANLKLKNIFLDERVSSLLSLLEKVSDPKLVAQMEGLIGMSKGLPDMVSILGDIADEQMSKALAKGVDPEALADLGGKMAVALSNTKTDEIEMPGSIFGILKKMGDPDRQKALGFLFGFLKNLGKTI